VQDHLIKVAHKYSKSRSAPHMVHVVETTVLLV